MLNLLKSWRSPPREQLEFRRRTDGALRWLRTCACCESMLPPIDLLCESCWARVAKLINRGARLRQTDYPFPVYSLFTWVPENDVLIGSLLHALKGGRAVRATERLVELFLFERARASGFAPRPDFVFPPRSASRKRMDHAELLAGLMARRFEKEWPQSWFQRVVPLRDLGKGPRWWIWLRGRLRFFAAPEGSQKSKGGGGAERSAVPTR